VIGADTVAANFNERLCQRNIQMERHPGCDSIHDQFTHPIGRRTLGLDVMGLRVDPEERPLIDRLVGAAAA